MVVDFVHRLKFSLWFRVVKVCHFCVGKEGVIWVGVLKVAEHD